MSSNVENHRGTLCTQHSADRLAHLGQRPVGDRNGHKQGGSGVRSADHISGLVIQLAPSVCALWVLVLARGTHSATWRGLFPVALLGLLNPGLSYTLSMLGLTQTTASVATLLWAAEPALIVVTAWLLLQETITPRFLTATAAAACGVLLVSGIVGGGDLVSASAHGAALILGGVLCCALYTVLSRKIASSIDPLYQLSVIGTHGGFPTRGQI
jgi:drug/metabolite transporter (DMT)-like permease